MRSRTPADSGRRPAYPPRISEDGTDDEHPPARDEMRQVVRQALDVFARLLLETLHFEDLGDEHVVGLTDGLSGHVRRPRKPPIRDRIQRPADDVAILRPQTLKVLGQLRRAQLKPHEKGRGRAHRRSVVVPTYYDWLCHSRRGGYSAPSGPGSDRGREEKAWPGRRPPTA